MHMMHIDGAAATDTIILCPNCGGTEYESNRLEEALYVEAAKEAPRLRHEGKIEDAIELLTALHAIRIVNFLRPDFRCVSCQATFDA